MVQLDGIIKLIFIVYFVHFAKIYNSKKNIWQSKYTSDMEHIMHRQWTCLLFLLLAACVKIPDHDLATLLPSCGCETLLTDAVNTDNVQVGPWPAKNWWDEWNDPVLSALIEEALCSNPSIQRARARLNAAAQFALQKRAALFPSLSFDPSDVWQHYSKNGFFRTYAPTIPAMVNDIMINLTFSYEFDFWGKNRSLFQAALGEMAAKQAEQKQTELIVSTAVAYTYQELQFLLRKQKILNQQEQLRQNIVTIRTKREHNALDTALIRLGSVSNTLDVSASLQEISPIIREHQNMLKTLVGRTQDSLLEIELKPFSPLQTVLPETLSLDLLARRPDLAALKARVEAAAKQIDAAKTDFYPNVNLLSLVGIETVFWSKIFQQDSYSGSLQPAIHLPIFTAGRLRAQLMEKVADFNDAVFAYNELILQATQNIANTLADLLFLQKEIEVREASLEVAAQQETLTQKRLQHALDDRIALCRAEYARLDAELLVVSLEYGKLLKGIVLIRELGGGYHDCP